MAEEINDKSKKAFDSIGELKQKIEDKQKTNAIRAKELREKITKEPNTTKANQMIAELVELESDVSGVVTNNSI